MAHVDDRRPLRALDGVHGLVQEAGDGTVALGGGVLVDQRRPRRGVADAGHELLRGDPGHPGHERGRVVAEIVDPQTFGRARRGPRRLPRR